MDEFLLVETRDRLEEEEACDILRGAVTILTSANINFTLVIIGLKGQSHEKFDDMSVCGVSQGRN
jgi:hypothetical protein